MHVHWYLDVFCEKNTWQPTFAPFYICCWNRQIGKHAIAQFEAFNSATSEKASCQNDFNIVATFPYKCQVNFNQIWKRCFLRHNSTYYSGETKLRYIVLPECCIDQVTHGCNSTKNKVDWNRKQKLKEEKRKKEKKCSCLCQIQQKTEDSCQLILAFSSSVEAKRADLLCNQLWVL